MNGKKQAKIPGASVRNQRGLSLVVVTFVALVITGFGYTLTEMNAAKQDSVGNILHSTKAFYIADAGIQYADKYLQQLADWSTAADDTKNLGSGSFSMAFSGYIAGPPESIDVTSTGTFGMSGRVIQKTFQR